MANVMTYAEAINVALEVMGDSHKDAQERLEALKAQLAKRGSKSGPTKTQKENEVLKGMILDILAEAEEPVGMSKLISDPRLPDGMSTQKLGALIRQLAQNGKVVKGKDKKHVVYSLADDASAEDADQ